MSSLSDLHAWEAALLVALRTRELLGLFPARGFAELRDQMIRSSESIGHNIAEGRASTFEREYIKYLDTAARSANELSSQITDAINYGIVPKWRAFNLNGTVICTRRMIESVRDTAQANYDVERRRRRASRPSAGNPSPKRRPRRKR